MKTDCKNQCFFVVSAWESVHCLALKSLPFYNPVSNKEGCGPTKVPIGCRLQ